MTKKGHRQTPKHRRKNSEAQKEYYKTHPGYCKGRKQTKATIKKRVASLKRFYSKNEVWNKGLHWPSDIKERIRESCIRSGVGKWNGGGSSKHDEYKNEKEAVGQGQ